MKKTTTLLLLCALLSLQVTAQNAYDNFKVSVYTRAYEVQQMEDQHWLDSTWQVISSQLHVDKIYLETHRDVRIVDEKTLKKAKRFFEKKGLDVAGGITYTIDEGNMFQTYCYSNPEHRKKAQEIIEYTATHFDEVILDDFFFTSCKCELCVEAKGERSWSEYRLALMTEAAENLILGPAHKVNPDVRVVVKYPNWYDHFQECGFNLETEPPIFDGLYTGTETRDAKTSDQHLQPYLGYLVFRYFENLKPGKNGGGWVDTYGSAFLDRYAEQLWITILAKAPEMTLFDYRGMISPLRENLIPVWKDENTSFNYSDFLPIQEGATYASAVTHSLEIIDKIAGDLGEPYGIKSYKPFHSDGEDYLQTYLGMIGIPMNLVSEFPMEEEMIILTEQAKKDPDIVDKIQKRLLSGKDVMITSGLLNALQERGIRSIVNLEYTSRKALVKDFKVNWRIVSGDDAMMIPQIAYSTNDSWEVISAMDGELGWPLLHMGDFGNATLYVLTIPDNFTDLYKLPEPVLNRIRELAYGSLGMTMSGPSKVSLFLYDNSTFVVESFNDEPVKIQLVFTEKAGSVTDLSTGIVSDIEVIPEMKFRGRVFAPEKYKLDVEIPAHSFRGFRIN